MAKPTGRPNGRPSRYTPTLAKLICERLAHGESLREICTDPEMPDRTVIYDWVISDRDGFADRYARARELQAEYWSDEIVSISDDGTNDFMEREGIAVPDHEHIQRSKLRVDTRKWLMSKLVPKRYGDKQEVEHSGSLTLEQALLQIHEKPDKEEK